MKTELYIKTCYECSKVFRTDNARQRKCPTCLNYKSPHFLMKPRKTQRAVGFPSIAEVSRIERIYNAVHGTFKHYGDMVQLIRTTDADRCVCCGEVIPEGRMVCQDCERKAKESWIR